MQQGQIFVLLKGSSQIVHASPLSSTYGGPVLSHGGSTAIGLEILSFHELDSAVPVDFSIGFPELNLILECGSLHLVPSSVLSATR